MVNDDDAIEAALKEFRAHWNSGFLPEAAMRRAINVYLDMTKGETDHAD